MVEALAIICVVAGIAALVFAAFALYLEREQVTQLERTVDGVTAITATPQAAASITPSDISEILKSLKELAESFAKLPRSIAALVLATVLFGFAVALVAADTIDDGVKPEENERTSADSAAPPYPART